MSTERSAPEAAAPGADTVRISCAIMAHPARADRAERLRRSLPALAPRIVLDPEPDGPPTTLRTALAAWSAAGERATHHLVLQDDAEPCSDFAARVTAAVRARPRSPLALFVEWGSVSATTTRWAAMSGHAFAECVDDYVPSVGLVLPVGTARRLVEFAARESPADEPDDLAIHRCLSGYGEPVLCTVPQLVDHDGPQSLMGHGAHMGLRRAALIRAADEPMADSGTLVAPPLVPVLSWSDGQALCARWDAAARTHVGTVPVIEPLASLGLDTGALLGAIAPVLSDPRCEVLRPLLGPGLLKQLWLTAVAVGVLAPGDRPDPGTPQAVRAIATMGPGGLRTLEPAATSPRYGPALALLTGAGAAAGVAARKSLGPAGALSATG
ncbi:hypothetical protein CGZ69_25305 [Streptomyces peucetius subsp. caesius ATCC 27952]|nr:hypothetical protein CGZ69_25305 [Streptomyces peucetius subsp. caesius ATCC 27952]